MFVLSQDISGEFYETACRPYIDLWSAVVTHPATVSCGQRLMATADFRVCVGDPRNNTVVRY